MRWLLFCCLVLFVSCGDPKETTESQTTTTTHHSQTPVQPPPAKREHNEHRLWVLCNKDIPQSIFLAKEYCKLHELDPSCIIELSLSGKEEITFKEYDKTVVQPLLRVKDSYGTWPQRILSIFGVPLRLKHDDGYISGFDSQLQLLSSETQTLAFNVNNVFYRREINADALLVSRLDAPTYRVCEQILKDWQQTQKLGLFRRYITDNEPDILSLFRERGLYTHAYTFDLVPPMNEVQFYMANPPNLRSFLSQRPDEKLGLGAMIICKPGTIGSPTFRHLDKSVAAQALVKGASTYIGPVTNASLAHIDFDEYHFLERLFEGQSFDEALRGGHVTP